MSTSATSLSLTIASNARMIARNGCSASRGTGAQLPWNAQAEGGNPVTFFELKGMAEQEGREDDAVKR
jgi:hypothetical protein